MKKSSVFVAVLIAVSGVTSAQTVSTLHLPKGQKYLVENKISSQNTQEVMGQSIEAKADFSSSYNIEVKDVKDDKYNLTNTIKTVKLNANGMGQDLSFDSDKKEDLDGENGSELKKYINQPKDIVIDKSGKVIDAKKQDTADSAADGNVLSLMMKQMIGDPEQGGYGVNMAFEPLPGNAKVGTTWADSSKSDGIMRVTNYTIKEIKGNNATIVLSGTLDTDTKSEIQGTQITTKTKGKFSGEDIVDMNTGVIQQRNSTMDSAGTINVMGQEIPNTTKVTSVITVKPI
jgi:Family of unknown function (DUF6263)